MKSFLILSLCLALTGCWTINQKSVPHGVSESVTTQYVQTTQELYNANEYLANNKIPIQSVVKKEAPIISTEKLLQHKSITAELVDNANFNYKYTGLKIEDTGLNLSKPIGILSILSVIVILILFPSIISILYMTISRLRKSLKGIVDTIEVSSEDSTKSEILQRLSKQLDKQDKLLISKIKHSN